MSLISVQKLDLVIDLGSYPRLSSVFESWHAWCGDAPAPAWMTEHINRLPPRLVPNTNVVDVIDGGRDLRFRFWGSGLVKLYGIELSGKLYSDAEATVFGTGQIEQFREVIATGQPALFETHFRRPNGMNALRTSLRLPFRNTAGTIDKVMTVTEIHAGCAPEDVGAASSADRNAIR